MRFDRLEGWLSWQESLNPAEIDLGLDRVARVLTRAKLSTSFDCPLITVAGTNGKGSVVAMLEAIAMAAGLNVCSYTSPHIFRYNERIKINAQAIADDVLCEAFERIDQARGDSQLTYFEFGTLAAIDLFFRQKPDLVILEVGLGGRLDAVNVMDADVSVLTSVAIDHIDWLGENRESIGFEKAGVFRTGRPVVCGELEAPKSVVEQAEKLACEFIQIGQQYDVVNRSETDGASWNLRSCYNDIGDLPEPSLTGDFQRCNAATAIMALQSLQSQGLLVADSAPVTDNQLMQAVSSGLRHIHLPGRFQQVNLKPQVYVDVAHNLQAAQALSRQIKSTRFGDDSDEQGNTWAIVAMLSDKDIPGVLDALSAEIDFWCFAGLEDINRGLSAQGFIEKIPVSILPQNPAARHDLQDKLCKNQCTMLADTVMLAETVTTSCQQVLSKMNKNDRIIIFGSFYTVAQAMKFFSDLNENSVELIN